MRAKETTLRRITKFFMKEEKDYGKEIKQVRQLHGAVMIQLKGFFEGKNFDLANPKDQEVWYKGWTTQSNRVRPDAWIRFNRLEELMGANLVQEKRDVIGMLRLVHQDIRSYHTCSVQVKRVYKQYYSKLYNKVVAEIKEVCSTMTPAMKCHQALIDSFKNCYIPGSNGNAELHRSDTNIATILSTNSSVLNQVRRDILLDTGAMGNSVQLRES